MSENNFIIRPRLTARRYVYRSLAALHAHARFTFLRKYTKFEKLTCFLRVRRGRPRLVVELRVRKLSVGDFSQKRTIDRKNLIVPFHLRFLFRFVPYGHRPNDGMSDDPSSDREPPDDRTRVHAAAAAGLPG